MNAQTHAAAVTAPAPAAADRAAAFRAGREARPPVQTLPAMAVLDQTHREMLAMLDGFDALLLHLQSQGSDEQARSTAGRLLAFFNAHAREHHAAEERHVFPPLLAGPDAELAAQVRRLQQDHGWLEEDWLVLAPQLEAVATGYNWYDLDLLAHALPMYRALLEEHIALEESLVYPAARRLHAAG